MTKQGVRWRGVGLAPVSLNPDPAVEGAVLVPVAADVEGGGVGFGRDSFGDVGRGWFGFGDGVGFDNVAVGVANFVKGIGDGLRGSGIGVVAAEEGGECKDDGEWGSSHFCKDRNRGGGGWANVAADLSGWCGNSEDRMPEPPGRAGQFFLRAEIIEDRFALHIPSRAGKLHTCRGRGNKN